MANDPLWRARRKDGELRLKYGISLDSYFAMLESQDNACAICGKMDDGTPKFFHLDHCHDTGKVRGILCKDCNLGLGRFSDDPDRLRAAIGYLEAALGS